MELNRFGLILVLILIFSLFALADENASLPISDTQLPQNNNQLQDNYQLPQSNNNQQNPQPINNQNQQSNNYQTQDNYQSPQQNNNQNQPYNNNQQQNDTSQNGMMQPQNNFGMPSSSSADPEYVAQQKMVEGMTTAYNWISLNTTHFSNGCKTDKDALITEIAGVVQSSQEASNVCQRFSLEVQTCNPELFCTTMSSGQLPLPPQTISNLKKLGYNPDTMKAKDFTLDLIIKVCNEQASSDLTSRTEMVAATKKSIQDQLPKFRTSCEAYKKNSNNGPNIQLPTFNFPTQEYAQGTGPNQQGQQQNQNPQQQRNPNPQQGQQPNNPSQNFCNGSGPVCQAGEAPFCENSNWVCKQTSPPQEPSQDIPAIVTEVTPASDTTTQTTTSSATETTTTTTPETTSTNPVVQTMVNIVMSNPVTGFFGAMFEGTQAVCGNGICEPDFGENQNNCSKDCMANQSNQGSNYVAQKVVSGQTNQSRGPGSSMSPQQLCTMTDNEIIAEFMGNMESNLTFETQRNAYRCNQESTNTLDQINQYSLQSAKCLANAALDCEAKRQAAATCNEMKDSPKTIATMIVNNMCLRFISNDVTKNNKLMNLAAQVKRADPALASQLSDTSEKNLADQKNLSIVSYLFGDGNYAQKLKERTDKLITARDKLAAKGSTDDKDVLDMLDAQINDLKSESDKFSNAFDLTRIGYMFGR
ncbi:MAG: hypothetical protein NTY48_05690 [Candidatus Diapherotrites archaeon]|nr:hypothetical protein [Candidatus Diapherotrites archaeon]